MTKPNTKLDEESHYFIWLGIYEQWGALFKSLIIRPRLVS